MTFNHYSSLFIAASLAVLAIAVPLPSDPQPLTCAQVLRPNAFTTLSCYCTASCVTNGRCCQDYDAFSNQVTQFMREKNSFLVNKNEALQEEPFQKQVVSIVDTKSMPALNTTLLVARKCRFEDIARAAREDSELSSAVMPQWELKACEAAYDVIAFTEQSTFAALEDRIHVPETVRVALGELPPPPDSLHIQVVPLPWDVLYYAELQGAAAVAAYKMALSGQEPISSLRADLSRAPTGKLDWDPTPDRSWKLENPRIELDQIMSLSNTDIAARELDARYESIAQKANYVVGASSKGYLRKIWKDEQWVDVIDKSGNPIQVEY